MDDLAIPAFLDRKTNGWTTPDPKRIKSPRKRAEAYRPQPATEAQRALEAERAAAAREIKKLAVKNGTPVYLSQRIENCPLTPGKHNVELVKLGRKWVRFRCAGRARCVRVRRVIWDAMVKACP